MLDLNRRQAIFWGEFIELAYATYVPGVPNPLPPTNFPSGWRLVKNITADAVVSFVDQKEFLGFLAQSTTNPNEFAVVLHGTEGIMDYLDDFEFLMTDFNLVSNGGKTEYGFTRFYESFSFVDPVTGIVQTLQEYLNDLSVLKPLPSFTVAGFSLGAALATLHAVVLASRHFPVEAYLFASPMVGNQTFVQTYNALVPHSYRIVNKPDIVPRLPGSLLGYAHVNTLFEINTLNFPEIKRSIVCFHSPNTYLYALGAMNTDLGTCRA
ncbi:MAG: lipase family protein [Alicyclobacillus sp.]|nr:lipase family protein [Alicyclobacillus sp.]